MTTRQYVYDLSADEHRAPQPGQFIRHTSAVKRIVSWFEIIDCRPVESRRAPNRWRMTVRRIAGPPARDHAGDVFIWPSYSHPRGCTCEPCASYRH